MAEDFDVEAMLEAPYVKSVSQNANMNIYMDKSSKILLMIY